ncbi:DUF1707 domain-containing protein [Micromonospora sp. RL09-050-HVF-A]|uniref:DUF1707 SHOCT-like domain-containing protein n=1 Tax=unclassified Micromonospora TaxID=2617518 RepID=UPI001C5FEE6B|nr:DUF1707 domain-containing protein [Micromonospora sp. RL09-050-HVF-A]MBW4704570.1 DUF1707 domain-containing protein [Micromonospora sp. RL09-050-HVF-A]
MEPVGTIDRWRLTDREREIASTRLAAAVHEGQLDLWEYDARLQALAVAKTKGELHPLLADLQPPQSLREGHKQRALAMLWTIWAGVVSLNFALWAMWTVAAGGGIHPWPVWIAVPTVVPLITLTVARRIRR